MISKYHRYVFQFYKSESVKNKDTLDFDLRIVYGQSFAFQSNIFAFENPARWGQSTPENLPERNSGLQSVLTYTKEVGRLKYGKNCKKKKLICFNILGEQRCVLCLVCNVTGHLYAVNCPHFS